jgi:dihydroceramide fatty acyl 2-hydroxylase
MKDYVRNQRGRMFESNFFEFFSKVHPITPFAFWIPLAVIGLGYSISVGLTTPMNLLVMLPLGYVTWQLMEYFIHKKIFHWLGNGPFTRRMHDILHGFHHKYPDDDTRLVMPLSVSIGATLFFGSLLYLVGRHDLTIPYWGGVLFGYLWYDFLHWSTHFRKPLTNWGKKLRAHHMSHHFADSESNFGISHMWIDVVLGTLKKKAAGEREEAS